MENLSFNETQKFLFTRPLKHGTLNNCVQSSNGRCRLKSIWEKFVERTATLCLWLGDNSQPLRRLPAASAAVGSRPRRTSPNTAHADLFALQVGATTSPTNGPRSLAPNPTAPTSPGTGGPEGPLSKPERHLSVAVTFRCPARSGPVQFLSIKASSHSSTKTLQSLLLSFFKHSPHYRLPNVSHLIHEVSALWGGLCNKDPTIRTCLNAAVNICVGSTCCVFLGDILFPSAFDWSSEFCFSFLRWRLNPDDNNVYRMRCLCYLNALFCCPEQIFWGGFYKNWDQEQPWSPFQSWVQLKICSR